MTFSSIPFIVFFAIVYSVILLFNVKWLSNKMSDEVQSKAKHWILLVASYIFYGWWDFRFCFLMLLLTVVAWFCAKQVDSGKRPKLFLALGVLFPLLVLGFFKYFNFFIQSFADLFAITDVRTLNIILPVGISFYTFQSMSYTIDVARKRLASHSLMEVALYVAFFPQLVAGPIVKASDFMPQLKENKRLKASDFARGIQIFMIGMFKKLVIADHLSVFVDDVFEKPLAFSSLTVILAVISYSIQIYCDFSGYSDMAVGVARCFGYHFERNFNIPYVSKNVSEFWKRWHISLSSWLQEYLYISLGGNRKGRVRTYVNLLLTMVIGGFWHGASYNFIIWGLLHGLALCVHKVFMQVRGKREGNVFTRALSMVGTYCFVCIGWIFFRADTLSAALSVLHRVFVFQNGITQVFLWSIVAIAVMVVSHIAAAIRSKKEGILLQGYYPIMDLKKFPALVLFFTFVGLIFAFAYTDANPFIYFQF